MPPAAPGNFIAYDIVYEGDGVSETTIHPIPELAPVLAALDDLSGRVKGCSKRHC
jgi:hypothetical protein